MLHLSYAAAEGYQVNAQSAKQSGMGHTGVALKLGAESMHFNPAGLGFLDQTFQVSAGLSGVFTNVKYSNGAYAHKADNSPSTPLFLYAGWKLSDRFTVGASLTNPYGSSMHWGNNWVGAALVQDISLKSFSVQPTLAYRITDRLSVGGGLMLMFGNFSLSRAVMQDVSATLEGKAGLKAGFNVGAMFDLTDQLTVGLSYRSKVTMRVDEGHLRVNDLDKGSFSAELPLPSNLNIGLSYRPAPWLLLSGEVQFVGWSAYKELNVKFTEEANPDQVAPKNYRDSRIYRIGGQFAATRKLDLRLGFYFDESPVKTDYLNPETPSMNKLGSTAGLSYRPTQTLSIDLSLAYIRGFGRDGSYPLGAGLPPFKGHYEVSALTPSIGLSYAF
jgi:long-chain fatty acid transport protein